MELAQLAVELAQPAVELAQSAVELAKSAVGFRSGLGSDLGLRGLDLGWISPNKTAFLLYF